MLLERAGCHGMICSQQLAWLEVRLRKMGGYGYHAADGLEGVSLEARTC